MDILITPINRLRRHECYESYAERMAKTDYLLRDQTLVHPSAIAVLLETMPIIAIQKGRVLKYIAGHRSYVAAASVLGLEAEVPVRVKPNPGEQQIRLFVAADIIASSILAGIAKKSHLGELLTMLRILDNATFNQLFVASTQKDLSAALNATKETIFRCKKAKDD